MQKLIKKLIKFSSILLIIALSACITRVEKHGYMFELADYQDLSEGVTSKTRAMQIMGSPTIISDLNGEEAWIYYEEEVKRMLFFKPDVASRKIILLKFDKNEILKTLNQYDLADEKKIRFTSDYTKVQSTKIGFFKSIFRNVGQVTPQ